MTVILHGTWLPAEQRFFVWGETTEAASRRGRAAKLPTHPFGAPVEELTDILPSDAAPVAHTLTIWLPAVGASPVPGRELRAAGVDAPDGEPTLAPWRVSGMVLAVNHSLDLLLAETDERHVGADLRAWRKAALLVMELVAGQQLLPSLTLDEHRLRALWQPRPVPATAQKIAALALALPPLCRAVVDDPAAAPQPRALIDDFLNAATDAFVRSLVSDDKSLARQGASATRTPTTPGGMWLAALLGPDPIVALKGREADELFKTWREWAGQSQIAGDESFRITFRLEPPAKDGTPWALNYLLQATDDPSLLVETSAIWRERGAMFTYLDRRFDQPQERLLRGLGFAARLFPPIERSLKDKTPVQATFSTNEAFTFLKEAAPLLEQSGFGVLVPSWWSGQGRLKARARVSQKGKRKSKSNDNAGRLTFASMINFRWEVSIGDEPIDQAEFERLVALKQPLVQVRGEWVALDPDQMQQALKLFERGSEMTFAELLRLELGGEGQSLPGGVTFEGLQAEGDLAELLRDLADTQRLETLPQPQTLVGTLRPYQLRGFSWMAFMRRFGLGACLADDMGLGKCLVGSSLININGTLMAAEQIWERYAGVATFDGEGFWAEPREPLLVNAIDATSGLMTQAPIARLYRQQVNETLRCVRLEDGNSITITQRHQLLTSRGWTNQLQSGDYVCVPARLLTQDVFYCRIKSVEPVVYAGWVYDFEVAEHHNFVANNIICHNTAQTIALLLHDKTQAPKAGPTLLVCPTSVVGNWQRELARFAPSLRVMTHRGVERTHGNALADAADDHDIVLTSYPLLARDRADLTAIPWRTAVLDEAQNIKNSDTMQAKAARSLQAGARVALTGTPVENRLTELWSIMAFLNPGYLGGETEFRREYARPIERAGDAEAAKRLRSLTAPFILRRLKTDRSIITDLPDKIETKEYVPLTEEQATLYEATVREALAAIEDADEGAAIRRRGLVLAMLTRLKQICNHPAHFLGDGSPLGRRSGKLVRLDEMLEEALAENDRALIFTQFAEMGKLLQAHLSQQMYTEVLFLHGGTQAKARDVMVRRFQAAEGPSIFILSLKAGGVGLNLTRANHVFHFDRWWNPAVEDQATDRAFRIGQVRNVQVHKFVCGGTLEEKIDDMIESKRVLAAQVLDAGEGWLTELNTDQLRELVALRRDETDE